MNRIRELRQKQAMTQDELAKRLRLGKSNISKYETGSLDPNTDVLVKLAEVFNCSVDYILGSTENPMKPDEEIPLRVIQMGRDFSKLPDERQAHYQNLLQMMMRDELNAYNERRSDKGEAKGEGSPD